MASVWPAKNNYATGDVLTAANMNGVGDDLNDLFNNNFFAGKNKIINGDFGIWQRGTSFSYGGAYTFSADRWQGYGYSGTQTVSQQTFTPGTAPVAGYEGTYFARVTCTNSTNYFLTRIEDVRTLAGQTVTLSFWAKSASNQTLTSVAVNQNFGSGGSGTVTAVNNTSTTITTSWARYSVTFSMPSISGKTIGTGSYVQVELQGAINNALDLWGFQLEAGSIASPFQTATGTKQGELAACQRYYQRFAQTGSGSGDYPYGSGMGSGGAGTGVVAYIQFPVPMRTQVSSTIDYSGLDVLDGSNARITVTSVTMGQAGSTSAQVTATVASGITQYRPYFLCANNNNTGYIGFSAEL